VHGVIVARIDRLDELEKMFLQIAAIIGKDFPLVVLQDIAGSPAEEIEIALERLCDAELLQKQPGLDGRPAQEHA